MTQAEAWAVTMIGVADKAQATRDRSWGQMIMSADGQFVREQDRDHRLYLFSDSSVLEYRPGVLIASWLALSNWVAINARAEEFSELSAYLSAESQEAFS